MIFLEFLFASLARKNSDQHIKKMKTLRKVLVVVLNFDN